MNLFTLFINSIFSGNIVLSKFLGICPFIGISNKEKSSVGMGIAVTIVIVLSSIITYLIYNYLLVPYEATYLKTIVFILVIASFVQLLEIILRKYSPKLYKELGIYLPLITTNCAVLGVVLLNIKAEYTFIESIVYAFGSSVGFTLVIYVFSTVREHLSKLPIPKAFKGYPIAFITAGIMALLFSRFGGV